jgi:hypothetical protein
MSKWIVRMIGILMILGFMMLFLHLQRRLLEMQRNQTAPPAAPATST